MNDGANPAVADAPPPFTGKGFNAGEPCPHPLYALEVEAVPERDPAWAVACYRVFEFAFALTVLVLTSPIILLQALIIRLDSPGPALFFQPRYGRSRIVKGSELLGRTDIAPVAGGFDPDKLYWVPTLFRFIKFRTMYADARQRFPELYRYQFRTAEEFHAAYYKLDNDPRVTRAGRWLRKLTIDELPNLWNVVKGEMALVGPRPENPAVIQFYAAEEMRKFTVRAGVTGFAQTSGRGDTTIGAQIANDLRYVRERSVRVDLKTLALTFWMVLTRHGAF